MTKRNLLAAGALLAVAVTAGCGGSTSSTGASADDASATASSTAGAGRIALLLAVQANPASAAVTEGAEAAASEAGGVEIDVFDAGFDAQKQYSQMQDAITTGKYTGILVQAVDGSSICSLVPEATAADISVGAVNSAIGTDFTSPDSSCEGVAASVVRPFAAHGEITGELTVQACQKAEVSPCEVGFLHVAPGAPFDKAILDGFQSAIAGEDVELVAEGNSAASREGGFTVIQQMVTAHPDIAVIVGAEQSLLGGQAPIEASNLDHDVQLVGIGGSEQGIAAVQDGSFFGLSFSAPKSEGSRAVTDLLKAISTGEPSPGVDVAAEPDGGRIDSTNAGKFTPEFSA